MDLIKISKLTLFTFIASGATAEADITTFAEYHLGEDGLTGVINDSRDPSLNFTNLSGIMTNAGIETDNVIATASTAYISTDINGTGNVGWFGANFSDLPADDFAVGIFTQASANTLDTQGLVVSLGNNAASLRISLAANGWAVSLVEPGAGDPAAVPPVVGTPAEWVGPVGGTSFTPDTWVHLAVIRAGGVTSFYIDGVDQGDPDSTNVPVHNRSGHLSVNPGGAAYYDGQLDELRVVTFTAGEATADILAALEGIDSDADGLFDDFEQRIIDAVPGDGIDSLADVLPEDDFDGDTLSNLDEQSAGTDPTVSPIPLVPPPATLQLLAFWDFNDASDPSTALDQVAGYPGAVQGGAAFTPDAGGRSGGAGDRAMDFGPDDARQLMSVVDGDFLAAVNATTILDNMSISFWQRNVATANSVSFNMNSLQGIRTYQAHLPWGNGDVFFDHWNGTDASFARISLTPPTDLDFSQWHHYVFLKNGSTKEVYIDGELFLSGGGIGLASTITSLTLGAETSGARSLQGMIDDFAIFDRSLTADQIASLSSGASPTTFANSAVGPQITDFTTDGNSVSLTWSSDPSAIYSIRTSFDLIDWTADVGDGIPGNNGSTTTRTINLASFGLDTAPKLFFRIEEEE